MRLIGLLLVAFAVGVLGFEYINKLKVRHAAYVKLSALWHFIYGEIDNFASSPRAIANALDESEDQRLVGSSELLRSPSLVRRLPIDLRDVDMIEEALEHLGEGYVEEVRARAHEICAHLDKRGKEEKRRSEDGERVTLLLYGTALASALILLV